MSALTVHPVGALAFYPHLVLLRGAKVSDGGPYACPNCMCELRPDIYVDDRVDYWCEHCRRVVAVSSPGWPAPKLEPFRAPRDR